MGVEVDAGRAVGASGNVEVEQPARKMAQVRRMNTRGFGEVKGDIQVWSLCLAGGGWERVKMVIR
jgi:hypothetical protein